MSVRALILTVVFLASLPFCFVRPFVGILWWTVIAFLNPQSFTWSSGMLPWAVMVAIPTIGGLLIFGGSWRMLHTREVYLLGILWIWFTITSFISSSTPLFVHHAQDTWMKWNFVSKILLMTVVMIPIVSTFDRLRLLVVTIALSFGFFVAKAAPFIVMTGGSQRLYGPEQSMIADNNDFGLALNMTLPLTFFLAQTETTRWKKRMFALLFVATIPAIFFTYSRGALLGLVVISTLMMIRLKQRWILLPVAVLGLVCALLFAPESWRARMDPTREDAVDASARARLHAWSYARALAADYPVAGGGFATFTPELFARYAPTAGVIHGPHSVYFGVLAEHGYVGLLLYLTLMGSCFVSTSGIIRRAKYRGDRLVIQYANMLRFSILAFAISGMFLGRAYFDFYWTLIACVVILKNVASDRWLAENDEEYDEEDEGEAPPLSPGRYVHTGRPQI